MLVPSALWTHQSLVRCGFGTNRDAKRQARSYKLSLLAIDVGTTGSKAAAFSEAGDCLAGAYREHRTLHPREGWAELDSLKVLTNVWEIIGEVAARTARDP